MGMFNMNGGDVNFFRKRVNDIEVNGSFKRTKQFCKDKGGKLVATAAIGAGFATIIPLVLEVFFGENDNNNNNNNRQDRGGRMNNNHRRR